MRSHLQDMLKPAVTALLDAIDGTMNGNAFLLKVQTDTLLTMNNYQETLNRFLRSPLFQEMIIEQDQQRKWYNYTLWVPNAEDVIEIQHPPGNLAKEHFELTCTSMDEHQFADRLHWMLTEALSPYDTYITEQRAQEVMSDFFREVFASESWPLDEPSAHAYWSTQPWFFSAVKPDFLHTVEENEEQEEDLFPFTYFEGGTNSDTCTFFYAADIFYLLFTNGSA